MVAAALGGVPGWGLGAAHPPRAPWGGPPEGPPWAQLSVVLSVSDLKGQCWATPYPLLCPFIRSEAQGWSGPAGAKVYVLVLPTPATLTL